ncbi:hypothetical protein OOU_Y34scaffold00290g36 [Pyricularia oryzae Y34]|uniref:Uncharacterized protein n=2 Tax=Pyricularia oryzae TaxID=318829 RepID=A0AA97PNN0_PYRO3|nr:hypothetical protein OOU_Y34scaffold00290g36 [Pyricularia oryzae Y34]
MIRVVSSERYPEYAFPLTELRRWVSSCKIVVLGQPPSESTA